MHNTVTHEFCVQNTHSLCTTGIGQDASDDEIKNAYRKKALELHPDTAGEQSEEAFKMVQRKSSCAPIDMTKASKPLQLMQCEPAHVLEPLEGSNAKLKRRW